MSSNVVWIGNLDGIKDNYSHNFNNYSHNFNNYSHNFNIAAAPEPAKPAPANNINDYDTPEYDYLDHPDCDIEDEVDVLSSVFTKLK